MIKRTLYFGNSAYLHCKNDQLCVDFPDKSKATATVPIEDIGVVILDAYRLSITQHLITQLLHNNVALITCNERHLPQGLMLNLEGNTLQQERFTEQIQASTPLKKQLWQQTIKAKIDNQKQALMCIWSETSFDNMAYWSDAVNSGDTQNYEARAAAFYWKTIFSDIVPHFKRGRFELEPNNLLNYGYAILRAITARSLVASGLLPTLGIHHHNKYYAYALADDIMEPYRPFVDLIIRDLVEKYYSESWEEEGFELTPEIKRELLQIPVLDVVIEEERSPLMIAMQRTTSSLYHCFAGNTRKIKYPSLIS